MDELQFGTGNSDVVRQLLGLLGEGSDQPLLSDQELEERRSGCIDRRCYQRIQVATS